MIQEIEQQINQYIRWLKDNTILREIGNYVEISTPYLDRHNDYIQIYAKKDKDSFILTDDGYTINDLILSGCKLDSPKRQELLRMTLSGFGIIEKNKALITVATAKDFPMKKHNFIQAILAVNDLFYLAEPIVSSLFIEDVENWLNKNEIRYVPRTSFIGKTGYNHYYDFVIPKSKEKPERILKALTNPNKNAIQNTIFSWGDTYITRPEDSQLYAILNDADQKTPRGAVTAFNSYGINPVPWSKRDDYLEALGK